MSTTTTTTESFHGPAIVSRDAARDGGWKIEDVHLRPIKDDELVIQVVASGICHTDLVFGDAPAGSSSLVQYPKVLGHEGKMKNTGLWNCTPEQLLTLPSPQTGSGYVKAVGSAVTVASLGDPVLLSFASCQNCLVCKKGRPSHCANFNALNFFGSPVFHTSTPSSTSSSNPDITALFFGQSSFASLTIVHASSVVNVKGLIKNDDELKLLAPLGCGIQTGSGTVMNVAQPSPTDSIAIFGLGGVGMSAIMAAKIRGCKIIIGVDRVASRLKLAKELGATHAIDTSAFAAGDLSALVTAIREITPENLGADIVIDTTGVMPLVQAGIEAAAPLGRIIQVGTPPEGGSVAIQAMAFMCGGKQYIGAVEGHAVPEKYVPEMIRWWREGKFPVEKFIKFFEAGEFMQGVKEMKDGSCLKPVVVW
ncbi:putative alcohol dehydrogenase [Aulographum hederae CBS 113979]|uniref:Putative alcohol dehydrogenase n=1 Tax=Aulographum hederae CBS 113979 TaxID=1176131 RepID=A0A6G1H9H8_9PEZI|nr:putative alcohol dehydrogenase [Aulographum hederae CBS 113979]